MKYTLKGAIWWKPKVMYPFDYSNVVYINRDIDANDAGEAIKAAKRIVKDVRGKNPSKGHQDYGIKAELFLGSSQPLWEHRFAKGKMQKEYWEKKKEEKTDNSHHVSYCEAAKRIFTEPPAPPQPLFRKGGFLGSGLPRRRLGSRAG